MLNRIKESCKYVMSNSKYVKINYDRLDEFIASMKVENLKNWLMYNPCNLLDLDIETIINFLLIFESIDYSFWGQPKWTIETEKYKKDGANALMYALLKYVKENNNTDFSELSIDEFKTILKGNVSIPLLEERYETVVFIN